MDDLISRKAVRLALSEVDMPKSVIETEFYDVMSNVADRLIAVPSVPAVPLDRLCEWLSENALDITRRNITPLKEDAEHWEIMLTKWMEGLDVSR